MTSVLVSTIKIKGEKESVVQTVHFSKVIFNPMTLHFTVVEIFALKFLGSAKCFINFPTFCLVLSDEMLTSNFTIQS